MLVVFSIEDIDHIEMFVTDRLKATKWHEDIFGLQHLKNF